MDWLNSLLAGRDEPKSDASASDVEPKRAGLKRVLSANELDVKKEGTDHSKPQQAPLLPPSPTSGPSLGALKGKAKFAAAGRKKPRIAEEDDEDEDDSSENTVVRVHNRNRPPRTDQDVEGDDSDLDPTLAFGARKADDVLNHTATRADDPVPQGSLEVNLPDELRLVLSISQPNEADNVNERVFRGLLKGSRVSSYDASRGGEVWDAGEDEDEDENRGDILDDDWEGEPVPWEVGEL